MKGLRTLLLNGATVVGAAALTWAVGVDWTQYVSPTAAIIIVAVANMGLRVVTTTPVGKSR
jgi:hypothetical protein